MIHSSSNTSSNSLNHSSTIVTLQQKLGFLVECNDSKTGNDSKNRSNSSKMESTTSTCSSKMESTTSSNNSSNNNTNTNNSYNRPQSNQCPFPYQLYQMLEDVERVGLQYIVSWQPNQTSFRIHHPKAFIGLVMKRYFSGISKIKSFQRQLQMYKFRRVLDGPNKGAYEHELFCRGMPHQCLDMKRIPKPKYPKKKATEQIVEPHHDGDSSDQQDAVEDASSEQEVADLADLDRQLTSVAKFNQTRTTDKEDLLHNPAVVVVAQQPPQTDAAMAAVDRIKEMVDMCQPSNNAVSGSGSSSPPATTTTTTTISKGGMVVDDSRPITILDHGSLSYLWHAAQQRQQQQHPKSTPTSLNPPITPEQQQNNDNPFSSCHQERAQDIMIADDQHIEDHDVFAGRRFFPVTTSAVHVIHTAGNHVANIHIDMFRRFNSIMTSSPHHTVRTAASLL